MMRSAAKNHARVTVVVDPRDYEEVLAASPQATRAPRSTARAPGAKAFAHTAAYDGAIAAYLSVEPDGTREGRASPAPSPSLSSVPTACATARTPTRRAPST
jgi:phosphoribosylaminoimidazolecarboxamide formyltransferase/IMP cyclohydrolase